MMDRDASHRATIALSPANHATSTSTPSSRITLQTLATVANNARNTINQAQQATIAAQELSQHITTTYTPQTSQLAAVKALPTAASIITKTSIHPISISTLSASIPPREPNISIPIEPLTPQHTTTSTTTTYYHPDGPLEPEDVIVRDTEEDDRTSREKLLHREHEITIKPFSTALETALAEVVPSQDPLDAPGFDPIAFINNQFPDESSLSGGQLDTYLISLRRRMIVLQETITRDVHQQSCQRSQTSHAVAQATTAIQDLFNRISGIKSKATQSELMVQEICRDIKSLDNAKKHLTSTIRALRNLHMLVSAVDQLQHMVTSKQYRDTARLFKAIADLMTLFEGYKESPKLRAIQQQVDLIKGDIRTQLFDEFHETIPSPIVSMEPHTTQMHDACLVVDVLGAGAKAELLGWFCRLQLEPYVAVFGVGKENASLDKVSRRYPVLNRTLEAYHTTYAKIFPKSWEVPALIAKEFCTLTRSHITRILVASKESALPDVASMVSALEATIVFEHRLQRDFGHLSPNYIAGQTPRDTTLDDEDMTSSEAKAAAIMQRYKNQKREAANGASENGHTSSEERSVVINFAGIISECFTPYMSGYVDLERINMTQVVDKIQREEKWEVEDNTKRTRFDGSDEVFVYIKKSITRCSKLTKNVTFFNIHKEYKQGLLNYAAVLESKLPKKGENQPLTHGETKTVCLLTNTAEYCKDTMPKVEENIRRIIEDEFKSSINLSDLSEEFTKLAAKCVQTLVTSMWSKVKNALTYINKYDWSKCETVGDQSIYVNEINVIFRQDMPVLAAMLSPAYHNFFCTQMAQTFIPRYMECLYKCKRVGEIGAHQLGVDAHVLRNILAALPSIAANVDTDTEDGKAAVPKVASKIYTRYVTTEMGRAESMLKVAASPNEGLILTFKAVLPKASPEELVKIMTMRGLKPSEQQSLIDAYNGAVPPEDRIQIDTKGLKDRIFNLRFT